MAKKFVFSKNIKRGDICPKCKSENNVTLYSSVIQNQRVRRRICDECKCRWNTLETFFNYVEGYE